MAFFTNFKSSEVISLYHVLIVNLLKFIIFYNRVLKYDHLRIIVNLFFNDSIKF